MSSLYYVLEGHEPRPASVDEFTAMFRRPFEEARRVAHDTIGQASVSTVFLGLDHGWGGGPPVLFETMVFGGPLSDTCERYTTWDEAVAGHARIVAQTRMAAAAAFEDVP